LPVGLQLLGRPFDEATLLAMAHQYAKTKPWHLEVPTMTGAGK
jgi:aspartyl-tRNA(Asn)/glutamyl-tRNA(Gln) amidotransferase subunit A